MSRDAALPPGIRVVSIPPPIAGNPYQTLLYAALSRLGVSVESEAGLRRPGSGEAAGGIVHVHWVWLNKDPLRNFLRFRAFFALLRRARRHRFRVVWTVHNLEPHDARPLEARLYRRLAAIADGLVAHSEAARRGLLASAQPNAPIEVIPHGNYRNAYGPPPDRIDARRRLGIDGGAPLFLFFGQLRRYKGVGRLVRAFRSSALAARLLVAGRPESTGYERELRTAAGDDARIRFDFGHVPDPLVPSYFAAADRVVLPFERVTTSGSAILALGFDRPLVLPRRPELVELAGEDAAVYFDGDEDLVAALARSLALPAPPAEAAARGIADRLAWEPIAARTRAFFERVLLAAPR